jgi:hypothetical protein
MRISRLFCSEMRFRPGTLVLGITAVSAVAGCVIGSRAFLAAHDAETDRLVAGLEARAAERMARLRDDARVFSKSLGFNILLLPAGQDAGRLHADHRSTHFFSAEDVDALGKAGLRTLNHLLPVLRHRIRLDAYGGEVILVGVEGEIYIRAPGFQKPIEEAIGPGKIHLGDAIRARMGLSQGDRLELHGRAFTVHRLLPQQGNVDDISILMNLGDVQAIAGLTGKVGGVLALSCNCAAGDLAPIRAEVARVLNGVQVVEFSVRARARQRARRAIGEGTRAEMDDIQASRDSLRTQIEAFTAALVALVAAGTIVLLAVLSVTSVRERRTEVAMLRALGLGSGAILALFLYKAVLIGVAGGVLGSLAGMLAVHQLAGPEATVGAGTVGGVIAAAVLVAVLASIVPALTAARTDPAVILV